MAIYSLLERNWQINGISGDIDLNLEDTPEFDQYSWVPFWYPLNQVVDFKKEAYRSALIEFKNQINK